MIEISEAYLDKIIEKVQEYIDTIEGEWNHASLEDYEFLIELKEIKIHKKSEWSEKIGL